MRKIALFILTFFILNGTYATRLETYFLKADIFFKKHVQSGKVNYALVKKNIIEVDELLKMAEVMSLASTPNLRSKAFYINTYNILVIHGLAKRYPISSPKVISGFHSQKKHKVNNTYFTLEGLKEIILKKYPDPRICFALVDGALGSPNLLSAAYRPTKIESQLNTQTKKMMNDVVFIRIKPASKKVIVSEILKWNKAIFGGENEKIIAFLNKYLVDGTLVPEEYTLEYYPFDWRINKL